MFDAFNEGGKVTKIEKKKKLSMKPFQLQQEVLDKAHKKLRLLVPNRKRGYNNERIRCNYFSDNVTQTPFY